MVFLAPAWARKRRRALVPAFLTLGLVSFVALGVLPPLPRSPVAFLVALMIGAVAWAALLLILNGERLPKPDFAAALLDPRETVAFDVHYEPQALAAAQRNFYWRTIREERLGTTIMGPVGTLFFAAVCWKLSGFSMATLAFLAFAGLTVAMQATLPLLVARHGERRAMRVPRERIRVGPQGIAVGESADAPGLAWSNFHHAYETETMLTLVMCAFMSVQLPKRDVPDEARKIIDAHVTADRLVK